MSFSFKKATAAAVAIVCSASMCGCMDSGFIGTIDGVQIRNGIYLSCLMSAYSNGHSEVTQANSEAGDTSEISDLFVETIDGKDAKEWIKEDTLRQIKRYVAVQRLFEERGLLLTSEEQKEIAENVSLMWDQSDMYAQYFYGTDTMGEYYDSVGIGKDSMKEIYTNNLMEEKVFLSMYDTDGDKSVTDDEINSYIKENYANVKYIELPFDDKNGINLTDEAEIQAVKDTAKEYADRINSGESFVEIQYDHDLLTAQNKAAVDAEDSWGNETGEAADDYDAYIQAAIDAVKVEKHESAEELERAISKASSGLDAELTEFIWNTSADGKANLFETDESIYVVVRDDITTKDAWKTENKISILDEIKGDEFKAFLEETSAGYSVDLDSYLVDTKYAPDKIKGIN